ncbi:MAG: hypothetical protein WDW36_003828 [Sanguina aurantia]
MTRSNSQRAGVGLSSRDTQAAAQEPTISAWATNQNSWEENPRDCRDEIKLYMADTSIQGPGQRASASSNTASGHGTGSTSREPGAHHLHGGPTTHHGSRTGGSSGSLSPAASSTSVTEPKTGSGGGCLAGTGLRRANRGSHQASAAAAVSSAPSAVCNSSSSPHPPTAAAAPLSRDVSDSGPSAQLTSGAAAPPAPLQHQTSFVRMPPLSESWPSVPTQLRGSVVRLPASGISASLGFATPQSGALPCTAPILRSMSSPTRRSRLSSSVKHRAPDIPRHAARSATSRRAGEAGVADGVLRTAPGSGSGLGGPLSSASMDPVGPASGSRVAGASLHAQASYDSSNDDAGSARSYVDLLDVDEDDDGGTVCSPLTAAAAPPPQCVFPRGTVVAPETGGASVLVLSAAEPGWQQLPERGVGINGQSIRAGAVSTRGSSSRQHLTAHDTCPQGNESPPGSGTPRTPSSPPRLGTAQHRRRTVFHSVPISPDASLLSVSVSSPNSKPSKGYTNIGATLLGATTAPLPRPLLTNLSAAAQSQHRGGENPTRRQASHAQQQQQQQLQLDAHTTPTTGIASVSGLMRLAFGRSGVRHTYEQPQHAATRATVCSIPYETLTTASTLHAAGTLSHPSPHPTRESVVGAPALDELSAAHSRPPRSPTHSGAESSGSHASHVQHRWGGQLLARLGGASAGGAQRPATPPTPGKHRDPRLTADTARSRSSLAQMEQRPRRRPPRKQQSTSHASVPAVPGTRSSTPTGHGHARASLPLYPLSAPDFLQAIPTAPSYAQPSPSFPGAGGSTRGARPQPPFAARKLRPPGCGSSGPKDSTLGLETMSTRGSHPRVRVAAAFESCGHGPAGSGTCTGLGGKGGRSRQPGGSQIPVRLSASWQGTERDGAILVSSIASGS